MWSMWLACRSDVDVAAERLTQLAPTLAELKARRVTYLEVQDWCRAVSYDRGDFVRTTHAGTCQIEGSQPFDLVATADVDRWEQALAGIAAVSLEGDTVDISLLASPRSWWRGPPPPLDFDVMRVEAIPGHAGWFVVVRDWN